MFLSLFKDDGERMMLRETVGTMCDLYVDEDFGGVKSSSQCELK